MLGTSRDRWRGGSRPALAVVALTVVALCSWIFQGELDPTPRPQTQIDRSAADRVGSASLAAKTPTDLPAVGEPERVAHGADPSVTARARQREASQRTWWSDALGADPNEPALIGNSDDRILVAVAAGLLQASDLRALADLIAANGLDESSSPFDRNDGDGVLSPWELGFQIWQHGRLVVFALGPDPHSSFRYQIDTLPESFEDLGQLRYLGLQQNRLETLPEGIGGLDRLEQLVVSENELRSLPESIDGLRSLERLVLSDNRLERLPETITRLGALSALHLADNPLATLPGDIARLDALRVLDLTRTSALEQAPSSVDGMTSLEEIYLAGHPLLCTKGAGGSQITLADGSIVHLYGVNTAGCSP